MPALSLNASKKTKQTPAGEIPVDWGCVKLGQVSEITGGIQKGQHRAPRENPVRYLTVAHVHRNKLLLDDIRHFEITQQELKRWRLEKGDILIVEGNGSPDQVGRTALFNAEIDDCVHQNHVIRARPNFDELVPQFANGYLNSDRGRQSIMAESFTSSGLHTLSVGRLREFPIPLPPLPEQRKIADILATWDRALETLDQLIAAKTRRKQALMQQLLTGKKRLPGFSGVWHKSNLSELVEVPPKNRVTEAEKTFAITVKLHCKGIDLSKRQDVKITETGRPYYQRAAGELLIGRQNFHNGGFGIVPDTLDGGIASNAISSLTAKKERLSLQFLLHSFTRSDFYKRVGHTMDGTGQKELSERQLLKLELLTPPFPEQTAIAQALDTADHELRLLKQQRTAFEQQKRGLMQQLLTGKVRVKP